MILWHNPRCSTSRKALELLREKGVEPELRLYLQDPPKRTELRTLRRMLGLPAIALARTREPLFSELGLTPESGATDLFKAMAAHPILIERPILVANGKARIGRPPEAILDLV